MVIESGFYQERKLLVFYMNNRKMKQIKEWLKDDNIKIPLEVKKDENESLGCIPIEEVDELLKKCACKLGIEYKKDIKP